jgi:hypothetical protein
LVTIWDGRWWPKARRMDMGAPDVAGEGGLGRSSAL